MPERSTPAPEPNEATSPAEPARKAGLDLSVVQVLGGALAAMTAAAVGSRISLGGTVVGAALASVVAAVATALYTASLRRTSETVRVVLGRRPRSATSTGSTAVQPGAVVAPDGVLTAPAAADGHRAPADRRRALVLRSVVGALAIFAIAAVGLTTFEALTGNALSGGNGTTFSQVQRDGFEGRPADDGDPMPASSESADPSASAEPTETPSAEPSASDEPSGSPQPEPTPTADSSSEPSAGPDPEPSATADTEPSATSGPSEVPSSAPSASR